ncbi:MAG TPA: SDR family NAD(P)-dependent oxidoreductase, partial [Spirochaetia bacterium]|nr:SDR family NAD(P)-dependent oxidoreductase [Spirochaetia bacterium]
MKPVREQVVMITGATDGLGRALAMELAKRGATLLLHGRSDERGKAVIEEIRRQTPTAALQFYRADLSRLSEVRAMSDRVAAEHDRLDALVNNAGVYNDGRQVSVDGVELAFQVNYLSHVLLTRVLLPLLKKTAPARIVNVASAGQSALDFDDLMLERSYDGGVSYRRSK